MNEVTAGRQETEAKAWEKKGSYDDAEMLAFANSEYAEVLPYLPIPPFLLVQRIIEISETGGTYGKGLAIAEYDINPDAEIFKLHFPKKPILPGSYGIEGAAQLTGFHLAWLGGRGLGMFTGLGSVELRGMVLPTAKRLRFALTVEQRRVSAKLSAIQGDVDVFCDDQLFYIIKVIKVKIAAQR